MEAKTNRKSSLLALSSITYGVKM